MRILWCPTSPTIGLQYTTINNIRPMYAVKTLLLISRLCYLLVLVLVLIILIKTC